MKIEFLSHFIVEHIFLNFYYAFLLVSEIFSEKWFIAQSFFFCFWFEVNKCIGLELLQFDRSVNFITILSKRPKRNKITNWGKNLIICNSNQKT